MDITSPSLDLIKNNIDTSQTVNSEQVLYNRIKGAGNSKAQLKKAGEEFEAIFITKMLSEMDKTVDKKGSMFGEESKYVDTFKSVVYQQIGHDLASNPRTTFGIADQIYKQMEKYVGDN